MVLLGVALAGGLLVSSVGDSMGKDAPQEDRLVSWGKGVLLLSLEGSRALPYPRAALLLPSVCDSNLHRRKHLGRFLSSCR